MSVVRFSRPLLSNKSVRQCGMRWVLLIVSAAVLPVSVRGGGLIVLGDHRDSFQSVRVAQMTPKVTAQVKELEEFQKTILVFHC